MSGQICAGGLGRVGRWVTTLAVAITLLSSWSVAAFATADDFLDASKRYFPIRHSGITIIADRFGDLADDIVDQFEAHQLQYLGYCGADPICPQSARDAGAVYYTRLSIDGQEVLAFYDENGNLVGILETGSTWADGSDPAGGSGDGSGGGSDGDPVPDGDLVGSLAGEFNVSGSASYSIPIEVPPAFGGLEPQLSLTYDSNGGNGALGVGWQVSGIDNITRCDRNIVLDGAMRAIQMDSDDRFCLKGKRLVAVDGVYGEAGTTYRTRIASFVQVESLGQAGNGPESFRVTTKAGEVLYFGEDAESRVTDGAGTVLTWSLRRVVDAAGNEMLLNYENTNQGHRPLSIDYSEENPGTHDFVHRVEFDWADRIDDISTGFVAGVERKVTRRLAAIRTVSADNPVREYRFDYKQSASTNRSLLTSIELCAGSDSSSECLPATTIQWQDPDRSVGNLFEDRTRIDDDWNSKGKTPVFFDYDGDGDTDILLIPGGGVYTMQICCKGSDQTLDLSATKLLTNNGGSFSAQNVGSWFNSNAIGETDLESAPDPVIRPVDYDGDGRQELAVFGIPYLTAEYLCGRGVYCRDRRSRARVIDWNGNGFDKTTLTNSSSPDGKLVPLDMNGDGRQALLSLPKKYCPSGSSSHCIGANATDDWVYASSRLFRYTGSGWASHGLGSQDSILVPGATINPLDLDGDGVTQLLVRRESQSTYLVTPASDGKSFNHINVSGKWGMSTHHWYLSRRNAVVLDFNGDGNQDILLQRKGDNNSSTYLLLSNGKGFEDRIDVTNLWEMDGVLWNGKYRSAVPHDFNGDGLGDILLQGIRSSSGSARNSFLLISDGARFYRHNISEEWGMNMSSWSADKRTAYVMNYDGDALPELVLHANGNRDSWLIRDSHDDPSESAVDRVTSIAEGALNQYQIEYEIAGLSDAYTPASDGEWSYPERSFQSGFVIATSSRQRDGIGGWRTVEYEYSDLRVHQKGHGMLGFGRVRQADLTSNQVTITDMHNSDSRLVGLVERTRVEIGGQLIRSVENEYGFAGNQPDDVYFPFLARSVKRKFELNGSHLATVTTENSGYDAWGNVGQVSVTTEDHVHGQTWQQVTDNTWDTSVPETGRLLASQVTHSHPDGSTMIRKSAFEYDAATGMLVSETVQPGDGAGLEQTTTYQLDRWGNKATTTVSGSVSGAASLPSHLADWPDRVTTQSTTIDTGDGLRVVSVTNAAGHTETREHRLSDGALVRQVGPNGLPTAFEYDALGRKTRTVYPDGTEETVNRQWGGNPEIGASVYHVTAAATGQPSETTWYDRLGRELGTTKPGLDGRTVLEIKEFSPRGAVIRAARPHFLGDTRHWIEFEYDARNRVTERSFPLGDAAGGGRGTVTTAYSGYVTEVTDAKGRTSTRERNARDQLIQAIDAMGEVVTYRYNAVGDLVETTDPLGRSTTFVYDVRGRKTRMTAPDMGTWQYTYNSFGELVAQTDAKGQTVYIDYDVLGRKVRRDEPEGTTLWCYDGSEGCGMVDGGYGAAIGKLVEVTGPEPDYRETIQYDDLGRSQLKTTWHLGEETAAYPVATNYDDKGRVDSMVYPEGFTLYNDYNEQGYLVRKVAPRDSMTTELDSDVLEAERLARMIARYEAKATDFRAHAALYQRMANDYAAAGDSVMATRLDAAADELLVLAAELDQAALDAQAELDQLDASDPDIDAETLRVRFGPDGESPEGEDPESDAARAAAETWLDAAEEHLARAEQAELDGLIELRDQELALAQNALAMARDAADEADVPEPGDDPTVAEMVPQGSAASECTSTDLYEVFWCAESADAEGRINKLHYGNGLVTHRDYEAASGQLAGIRTEAAGDPGIVRQDLAYEYDRVNNVTRRDNLVTGIAQNYLYDANDRLTQAQVSLDPFGDATQTSTYNWAYDAMGNRISDTRVGTYVYDNPSNPGQLTIAGGDTLNYDANGNVTDYAGKVLTWSSFNKPTRIEADGTAVEFTYGADRSRYRRHEILPDGTTKTTRYVGKAFERTLSTDAGGNTTTEDRYFIHAAGRLVAIHTENRTADTATNRFLHRDALGTVTLVTDAMGQVVERYAFRPFGERVVLENTDNAYTGAALAGVTPSLKRGFTGHEHIDGVGLIHMNGRVYDPRLGRFLSADPNVQFLDEPRGYNRYVYVQNNPLKYSDPSGYLITVVFAIAMQYMVSTVIANAFVAAFVAGFLTGLILSGGDLKVAFRSGVMSTMSAGWARGIGGHWNGGVQLQGTTKALAHGISQGIISEANGGKFQSGFVGGFAGSMLEGANIRTTDEGRVVVAAVAGGTVSELSGGKFANGAISAAFVEMFNHQGRGAEESEHRHGPSRMRGGDIENPYQFTREDMMRAMQFSGGAAQVVFGGAMCISSGGVMCAAGGVFIFHGAGNIAQSTGATSENVAAFAYVGTADALTVANPERAGRVAHLAVDMVGSTASALRRVPKPGARKLYRWLNSDLRFAVQTPGGALGAMRDAGLTVQQLNEIRRR